MVTFTVESLEFFLLIVARLSAFIYSAPIFSQNTVPRKVKAGLSIMLAIIAFQTLSYESLEHVGVLEFAFLIIKELVAGLIIGYSANICMMILSFAGHLIDTEIGFGMAQTMDPSSAFQSTITGNLYTYMVLFVLLITNAHLYLLDAIMDTFELIPIGKVIIPNNIYLVFVEFLVNYFIIAFRIFIPMFLAMLIVNVVLGILSKVSPEMNMFAVGIQFKVFAGLAVVMVMVGMIPSIADYIFVEMKEIIRELVSVMSS